MQEKRKFTDFVTEMKRVKNYPDMVSEVFAKNTEVSMGLL